MASLANSARRSGSTRAQKRLCFTGGTFLNGLNAAVYVGAAVVAVGAFAIPKRRPVVDAEAVLSVG